MGNAKKVWAAPHGAFAGSDIASDKQEIAGCSAKDCLEPGQSGAVGSTPAQSTIKVVHAIAYMCSDNRRYFTKRGALHHEAWLTFKASNDPDGEEENGRTFYTDAQMEEFALFANGFRYDARIDRLPTESK